MFLEKCFMGKLKKWTLSYFNTNLPGAGPLLLLPENIRIRKFNLQMEAYHDFLEEQEHIMALDYDWDHNNTGLSMSHQHI